MDSLVQYSIPVRGLRSGTHQFDFQVDDEFFRCFESSPIAQGNINLTLLFDKRPDMYVLQFDFEGTVKSECDRCLASIDLPVSDSQRLVVKLSEQPEAEDAEVIYIHPEDQHLNVATYIYEYIILSMPFMNVYDCENDINRVCNLEMLQYLQNEYKAAEEEEENEQNPFWEELKKLNIKNH
ncbi:MAG: DUF177 domain-containing protein [Saprospiraceae bacterium]|nr:DUF177 domain-containing protein [Saprospiraceae bacterium]